MQVSISLKRYALLAQFIHQSVVTGQRWSKVRVAKNIILYLICRYTVSRIKTNAQKQLSIFDDWHWKSKDIALYIIYLDLLFGAPGKKICNIRLPILAIYFFVCKPLDLSIQNTFGGETSHCFPNFYLNPNTCKILKNKTMQF